MYDTKPKTCVECKDLPAMHWNRSFCLDCFRKLLKDNLTEEDKRHASVTNQES